MLPMTVEPSRAFLPPGSAVQFQATLPAAGTLVWTVDPPAGGTISPEGLFTAAGPPGSYIIQALLTTQAERYAGRGVAVITQPATEGASRPQAVLASGNDQHDPQRHVNNDPQVGQAFPSTTSTLPRGIVVIRHGFVPPVQDAGIGKVKQEHP
ncbi:MAG TPA: hypothetical protein VK188_07420 [Holophaga sp.]|nr:hypothetical protein [Holophaga sp.]